MNSYQFYTPRLSPLNKIFIILTVILFLLSSGLSLSLGFGLNSYLGLSSSLLFKGGVHGLFTYPFMGTGLFEVVFDSLLLWFLGSELELMWGKGKYLGLFIFSSLLSGFFYIAVSLFFPSFSLIPLTGLGSFCNAMLVSYALIYPERYFSFFMVFPLKAKWFCLILLGMQLYSGFFSPGASLAWGHMGGMLAGYLFMKVPTFFNFKSNFLRSSSQKKKGNLRLLKNEDNQSKYWH